jgi:hypothetical protein
VKRWLAAGALVVTVSFGVIGLLHKLDSGPSKDGSSGTVRIEAGADHPDWWPVHCPA